MEFQAVIFDLDGLLVNTDDLLFKAANDISLEWKGQPIDREFFCRELGDANFSHDFAKRLNLPSDFIAGVLINLEAFFSSYELKLKPGARELLQYLVGQKIKIALASNSIREFVDKVIDHLHLKRDFETIVSIDDVTAPKPAPDLYLKAAKILKIQPNYCLALDDSPPGIVSAAAAGCQPLFVPNSYTLEPKKVASQYQVRQFDDLNEVLELIRQ